MPLSKKDFRKKVEKIRQIMPYYSNDRRVVVLGEDTSRGQQIISMGSRYEGIYLSDVYTTPSEAKQAAWYEVWDMYVNSRHGESFSICSHNCQNFTVSWLSDDGLHVLTHATEYLVVFNE